ncbi:hypothetical protein [Actinoplanes sp. L3-i22]|uniref:hypothetical protein n=1 Tax=Actinoplanes sp. L3-i22 TaxID=2836373 RepID=UPI001C77D30F|nr:hypothetical protein [Actinoplanes sp. L3-i22]BCY06272.1 hypothetical protein L3i22_013600 [Actinoplanes sp. L3-i22]
MPTLEARVTRLEERMDEQERLRASQDNDLSDIGEKLRVQHSLIQAMADTQSEHTALLNKHSAILDRHSAILDRHTALHREHSTALAQLTLDVHILKDGVEQIVGMLDTLIERGGDR